MLGVLQEIGASISILRYLREQAMRYSVSQSRVVKEPAADTRSPPSVSRSKKSMAAWQEAFRGPCGVLYHAGASELDYRVSYCCVTFSHGGHSIQLHVSTKERNCGCNLRGVRLIRKLAWIFLCYVYGLPPIHYRSSANRYPKIGRLTPSCLLLI